jgi:hypothetical protein
VTVPTASGETYSVISLEIFLFVAGHYINKSLRNERDIRGSNGNFVAELKEVPSIFAC